MAISNSEYQAIHYWLRHRFRKTGFCEECKKACRTHWANISGEYHRERDDFREICSSCHKLFDGAEARGNSLAAINKAKTHCIHGHAFDVKNTRLWHGHRFCIKCQRAAHLRHRARPEVKAKRAEQARADREASHWP